MAPRGKGPGALQGYLKLPASAGGWRGADEQWWGSPGWKKGGLALRGQEEGAVCLNLSPQCYFLICKLPRDAQRAHRPRGGGPWPPKLTAQPDPETSSLWWARLGTAPSY